MPALVGDVQSNSAKRVTTLDISSLVVGGSNRAIYVFISAIKKTSTSGEATDVRWDPGTDNQQFTDLGTTLRTGTSMVLEVWRLLNPTVKTSNVQITWADSEGSWSGVVAGAYALTGVDIAGTPDDGKQTAQGNSTSASLGITSSADDLAIGATAVAGVTATPVGGSQTDDWNILQNSTRGAGGTEDVDSATLDWTLSSAVNWIVDGCNIN